MQVKSKRGALRRYDASIRQCNRDAAGGTQYGIDWPTLRILWPKRFAEIQALRTISAELPA